ncbi:unnamed protein product, partial [Prorocentrum cordatum]
MAVLSRVVLAVALLASPAAAYVAPVPGEAVLQRSVASAAQQQPTLLVKELVEEPTANSTASGAMLGAAVASIAGTVVGWLRSSKQRAASTAAASALALVASASPALAEVDYVNIEYLGGSNKVDINNANIMAYRQFPGMFPTACGWIGTHGPWEKVSDMLNDPELPDNLKQIIQKYEKNYVAFPANPAYFIDRINNAMYRPLMAVLSRVALAVALLASPAAAYVAPVPSETALQRSVASAVQQQPTLLVEELVEEPAAERTASGAMLGAAVASIAGAVVGWLRSSKQRAASAAAASAVALVASASPALAEVDYINIEYLGGSNKVDINNANIMAYRQFPGMFPTASGWIGTHGPWEKVSDMLNDPELPDNLKQIIQKYEKNYVAFPANPAYFIDRINNAMYR